MSKCHKCNVIIKSNTNICPLCKNEIEIENTNDIFPYIANNFKNHKLLWQIFLFFSLLSSLISLFINYLINKKFSWSYFVIIGNIIFLFTIKNVIRKRNDFYKALFIEIVFICFIVLIWDYKTGWNLWSITYVIPFLCIFYEMLFAINRLFINRIKKNNIILTIIISIIGLIPLPFLLSSKLKVMWPSIISVILSTIYLLFLIIFNHKLLQNEIERRFHF